MKKRHRRHPRSVKPEVVALEEKLVLTTTAPAYVLSGLNIGPYTQSGQNPNNGTGQVSVQQLTQLITAAAPYTSWVKFYASTGDLAPAPAIAHSLGLKVAVVAYLDSSDADNQVQIAALVSEAKAGDVDMAVVGNEALLQGTVTVAQLIGYIDEVKSELAAAGIDIPVTTEDVYGEYLSNPSLISNVDVVLANFYPYWEGTSIDDALSSLNAEYLQLRQISGTKPVEIGETGWPSAGQTTGNAVASEANAATYMLDFVSWARDNNVPYFYFEAYDEPWKATTEGAVGPYWGILDTSGNPIPEAQAVFAGDTVPPSTWGAALVQDFATLPETITTNLNTYVIAGAAGAGASVSFNGTPINSPEIDANGTYAFTVPLTEGTNTLTLTVTPSAGSATTITRTVVYDPTFSTANDQLVFVDAVAGISTEPSLVGTIVIDATTNFVLGIIPNRHIRGISPDGSEIYMDDDSVFSTATMQQIRTLPFATPIPSNGFLVSPDGTRLYSRNQVVDVASNTLLPNLPMDISTGDAYDNAPIPGGPAITPDGTTIYTGTTPSDIYALNTSTNVATLTAISSGDGYLSDLTVTPDGNYLIVSDYGGAAGVTRVFNLSTFSQVTQFTMGDFNGAIAFLGSQEFVSGAAGNPANGGGGFRPFNLSSMQSTSDYTSLPLAANVAGTPTGQLYVSTGLSSEMGINAYQLDSGDQLSPTETFFLGINGNIVTTGVPTNNEIQKLVVKPGLLLPPISTTSTSPDSTYGQSVTLTATVTAIGTGPIPTGSIQFQVNGTNLGNPEPLVSGSASITTADLPSGADTITAEYSGDTTYNATDGSTGQGVNPAPLTVSAVSTAMVYGQSVPSFQYEISGFVNDENATTAGLTGTPTLSCTAAPTSGVGSYTISVSAGALSAPNYYFPASNVVSGTLTVTPAPLSLAIDSTTKTYGQPNPTFTGTLTGLITGDQVTVSYDCSATAASGVSASGYPITFQSLAGPQAADYTVTSVTPGTLTIVSATLTVTANTISRTYGAANPALTYQITGWQNGDQDSDAVSGVPSLSTTAVVGSGVGEYPIVIEIGSLSASNYTFELVPKQA